MDIKKAFFLKKLEKAQGVVLTACNSCKPKFNRSTHYDWYNSDPEYKKAVDAINDAVLDFAEDRLYNLIKDGDTTATIFLLKCRGRARGYIEKPIEDTPPPVIVTVEVTKEETKKIAADLEEKY